MKKLVIILALNVITTLSITALEKPGYENVDFETYRIETLRGENPKVRILLAKLASLRKQAQKEKGQRLEQTKAEIKKLEKSLGNTYK